MNVLLCGADGFIGRHLAEHLAAGGHRVVRGVRRPRMPGDIAIDYAQDTDADAWVDRLNDIDAVINAVGILIETAAQPFVALHEKAPQALFDACVLAGVDRVVQISALGADQSLTPYLASKAAADGHLARLPLQWAVVRPSIVYGDDGASSRFFRGLASLPVIGLPGKGDQALQPIHIDDLGQCVLKLLESPGCRTSELGGPRAVSYRQLLATYRRSLGFGEAVWMPIPMAIMSAAAHVSEWLGRKVLSRDTLAMLARGNTTATRDAEALLGRPPRNIEDFIVPSSRAALRAESIAAWSLPLLRFALAMVWIAAAVVSAGLYPKERSLALLAPLGLTGVGAIVALYGAAALDTLMGVLTLARPSRALWLGQILLVGFYSLVIAIALPEFWLHPFGPLVKNLPILAVLFILFASEEPKWTT
jgi:uncharacterized protein YbjT (DUF2867 family)